MMVIFMQVAVVIGNILATFPQFVFHSQDLTRKVLGLAMLMFPPQRRYHHNLRSTDGPTIMANWLKIVVILVHYQPSYNTSHTMKPSDPLLLADVTLRCGMYPADQVDIS